MRITDEFLEQLEEDLNEQGRARSNRYMLWLDYVPRTRSADVFFYCVRCWAKHTVPKLKIEDLLDFAAGKSVQEVFPHLSPTEREQLITGICPKCQAEDQ